MSIRVVVLGMVLVALAGTWACAEDVPMATLEGEGTYYDADAVVMGGHHNFSRDGIRTAQLEFDTAFQWRDSVNTHLRGVDLIVFNEGLGTQRATVTSLRGIMDARGDRLTAMGDVELFIPEQNRRVRTQELHYDPHAGRIWGDSAFTMTHQGSTIRGSAFTSDLEFLNFRVTGPGG